MKAISNRRAGARRVFKLSLSFAGLASVAAALPSFTSFSVPGAVATYPSTINASGVVAGVYTNGQEGVAIGFVRAADGTITTFNPANSKFVLSTVVNDSGNIFGSFQDTNGFYHGYYRNTAGNIRVFDIMNGTSFTAVYAANNNNVVAGTYYNSDDVSTGFIFNPVNGSQMMSFSIPSSTQLSCASINDLNQVTGDYADSSNVFHGFLWAAGSSLVTFDIPNQATPGTYPTGINSSGEIEGFGGSSTGINPPLGFLRSAAGTITTFAPVIAQRIYMRRINAAGQAVGYFADAFVTTNFHGVILETNGRTTTFDVPKSSSTEAWGINDTGQVTGYSTSRADGTVSGFIRTP